MVVKTRSFTRRFYRADLENMILSVAADLNNFLAGLTLNSVKDIRYMTGVCSEQQQEMFHIAIVIYLE